MTNPSFARDGERRYARIATCISALLFLAICIPLFPQPASADVRNSDRIAESSIEERGFSSALCPNIEANHALLIDADGKVYFERGAHDPAQIASITKVMTALVALDYDPNQSLKVTVTQEAAEVGESSAALAEGDVLDMKNALTAMMVASGNDAAMSIATSVGRAMLEDEGQTGATDSKAVERFVKAMNEKAAEMGLEDTVFTNPHGLDDGEYGTQMHSTCYDVAAEVKLAMQNSLFRSIVGSDTATVKAKRDGQTVEIELQSTDELLGNYEGTVGVKTGFTDLAGACFAGANDHEGGEYYAIVLDSPDEYQRFVDTQTLWDWCYKYKQSYPLAHSPETIEATINKTTAAYPVMARVSHLDWIDKSVAATIADPSAAVDVFALDGNVSQDVEFLELHGHVSAGDTVGSVSFKQRNNEIARVDLVAAEDMDAPDPITAIGIWWERLWGNDTVAPNEVVNETPLLIDKTQSVVAAA